MAWGCASRALDPEHGMGDRSLVLKLADGFLLAVVDGLGHGKAAAEAARTATAALERHATSDLRHAVERCHEEMKPTRGATLGLAWLDLSTSWLTWLGIGSVAGALHRLERDFAGSPPMPQFRGIVGRRIPAGQPARVRVGVGDTIVLATDGVKRSFADDLPKAKGSERQIAERLIEDHASNRDDALVLVARCVAGHA
jgi:negative regulator of sigma-B (phosphoserine phosphatase)